MLRIPVEVRAEGKCEKYAFSIPAYTCKEDLKQVVEDGMLIHNRNFVQSVELVCSQLLCTILVSLSSHFFTLRCSFVGCYGYPEHDLPTSRVLTQLRDAERLRLYAKLVVSDHRALSASLAEAESSSRRWENEVKGSIENMARAKADRAATHHDASMARMDADVAGNTRAKVEFELARVQNALVVAKEARWKAKKEASRLADKRVSLLLELETCKDEVSIIQA